MSLKPYALRFDSEQPFFVSFLKNGGRHPSLGKHVIFFQDAKKFIVDPEEFHLWAAQADGYSEYVEISKDKIITPYKSAWIEFRDLKNFTQSSSIAHKELNFYLYGIGFDLERNRVYALWSDFDKQHIARIAVFDIYGVHQDQEYVSFRLAVLNLIFDMTRFLQIKHVEAVVKNATIRTRFKKGKKKPFATAPYAILYLRQPTNQTEYNEGEEGAKIEWQHRWRVRGHWRRIKGIGHDYEGKETLGFTWVTECVKGPQDKPFLDRLTIVKDSLPPNNFPVQNTSV